MLTIKGMEKRFGDLAVFTNFNFQVEPDEFVAIVGPSGAGKTTLLNLIAGLDRPDVGEVNTRSDRISYVFQEDRLFPWLTLEENIRVAGNANDNGEVERLITLVGLSGFTHYYPDELSGGMRQRASIARAYYYQPDLLLMDEPFAALDYTLRYEMMQTLMKVRSQYRTAVLFITHHVADALAMASRIVVLSHMPAKILTEYRLDNAVEPRTVENSQLVEIQEKIANALTPW